MKKSEINFKNLIDDTNLKADATEQSVRDTCKEAIEINAACVCVNPYFIEVVKEELKGTNVKVGSVVGFPLGQMTTKSKVFETKDCIRRGCDEIDMVINVSALKEHKDDYVLKEIKAIKKVCGKRVLKVILECCLLNNEEIERGSKLVKEAGADFVKTSTGFSTSGAKAEDVKLMRKTVGPDMGVKAAGGIRTQEDLIKMVKAGANRIGASHAKNLVL